MTEERDPKEKRGFASSISRPLWTRCAWRLRGVQQGLQARRLRRMLLRKPLFLKIETTNACNARCRFCAYGKSARRKQMLDADLYDRAISGYVRLGGGPITLTPVVGDPLLDPMLEERIAIARRHPDITDISFTTNLIAHRRLSDAAWENILSRLRFLQVSLGGLDRESYRTMYGIDAYQSVDEGVNRIADIKRTLGLDVCLSLAFRTRSTDVDENNDARIQAMREAGFEHITAISEFGNWGGAIGQSDMAEGTTLFTMQSRLGPCAQPSISLGVLSDGTITGCQCVDMDGALALGNLAEDELSSVWCGDKMQKLRQGFGTPEEHHLCRRCNSYTATCSIIRRPCFAGATPSALPDAFYREFLGA